ncbi:hypothetical protein GCM10010123_07280 [Pilimelia anulata]|uniref:Peptidase S8/S53 domain-containing protein n=1 Tax=Pilimelia anulata TaxID=53371 RepID=A0A8J3F7M2_9ACTN|nr:S8 family serine peptidase [Pilimelia anulata]GGJ79976.1 hypothetical protein GCM10010123_07280 [Pilimelia anulata]
MARRARAVVTIAFTALAAAAVAAPPAAADPAGADFSLPARSPGAEDLYGPRSNRSAALARPAQDAGVVTANDAFWPDAWYERTGVDRAWQLTTGDPSVTVAVLDTGVSATPDLPAERLVAGRDVVDDDNDPADADGHGTAMAGIIAAAGNDGVVGGYGGGAAGYCWQCTIMPVRVLDRTVTGGRYADVIEGIEWAVAHGADVISIPLGGRQPSAALDAAVAAAVAAGVPVIAGAGYRYAAADGASYPAASPGAIGVGRLIRVGEYSNGRAECSAGSDAWVDIVALDSGYVVDPTGAGGEWRGADVSAAAAAGTAALVRAAAPTVSPAAVGRALAASTRETRGIVGGKWWRCAAAMLEPDRAVMSVLPQRETVLHAGTPSGRGWITGYVEVEGPASAESLTVLSGGDVLATAAGSGRHFSYRYFATMPGTMPLTVVVRLAGGGVAVAVSSARVERAAALLLGNTLPTHARGAMTVDLIAEHVRDMALAVYTPATGGGWDLRFEVPVGPSRSVYGETMASAVLDTTALPNGRVLLRSAGTDVATGQRGEHDSALIEVDNTAPTVSVAASPRANALVRGTVAVTATARDAGGIRRVDLVVNGRVVATDTRAPYRFAVDAARQPRTMRARVRATDRAGNVRHSSEWRWRRR